MDKKTEQAIQRDISEIKKEMTEIKNTLTLINTQLFHSFREYKKIDAGVSFLTEQAILKINHIKAMVEILKDC